MHIVSGFLRWLKSVGVGVVKLAEKDIMRITKEEIRILRRVVDNSERWFAQHGWTGEYGTEDDLKLTRHIINQLELEIDQYHEN